MLNCSFRISLSLAFSLTLLCSSVCSSVWAEDQKTEVDSASQEVSYHEQIRPIFQAHCQGCHQPAKKGGEYDMTSFASLLKGGESEAPSVVSKDLENSYLWELINPVDGEAEMPKGKKPLSESERDLIRQWILQGAQDDTPELTRARYSSENPPVYTRPPVITSLDYSPDGKLLAIAGFHEVLLYAADGSKPIARLVGLSERIETVEFSPDGKLLAVGGGLPGRSGEIQIWDVEARTLKHSHSVTYDTIYGTTWSPDGKLLAFGCTDTTVRAIEAATGKQVLYQGSHENWILDTVWSVKGTHVISVGRDRTAKLTELATERFIDNITSITPGALKGGIGTVARHPERDNILVGGADGVPKVYRVFRKTARKIGDDANLVRRFPPCPVGSSVSITLPMEKASSQEVRSMEQEWFVFTLPISMTIFPGISQRFWERWLPVIRPLKERNSKRILRRV